MKYFLFFLDMALVVIFGVLLSYLFGKPVVLIGYMVLFVVIALLFYVYPFISRHLQSKLAKIAFWVIQGLVILGAQLFLHTSIYPPIYSVQESFSSLVGYEEIRYEGINEEINPSRTVITRYKFQECLPQKIFDVYLSFLPDRSLDEEFVVECTNTGLRPSKPFIELIGKERLKTIFRDYEITLIYKEGKLKKEEVIGDDENIRIGIVEREITPAEDKPKYFSMLRKYLEKREYSIVKNCKSDK